MREFTFKVIFKWGRSNVWPDHLSRLELGESGGSYDDQLSNAHLFHVEVVPNYLEYFSLFLVQDIKVFHRNAMFGQPIERHRNSLHILLHP